MPDTDFTFDPATEEGTPPFTLLPPGKYTAEVIDSSISTTKNLKGTMLGLTWSISEPAEFEHRLVFQSILVTHESADAQRYGRYKLKDLCDACGITNPVTDISAFHHKSCTITVGIERDKDGVYSDRNKVTRIMKLVPGWTQPKPATAPRAAPKTNGNDMDDEIPF